METQARPVSRREWDGAGKTGQAPSLPKIIGQADDRVGKADETSLGYESDLRAELLGTLTGIWLDRSSEKLQFLVF